tara:strand:- start:88 stop:3618 length:3531 start_codon:yes stop_codon:yes gene_type:complete
MTENENLSYEEEDVTTKAGLVGDNDFLTHAQRFLQKRTHKFYSEPEEIYSEWIEQFRSAAVNEVSAIKDFRYISSKERTEDEKAEMGRLYIAYEKLKDAETGTVAKVGDYAEALVTSPTTAAAIFSGGISKLAGIGGTRAAVEIAKAMAKSSLKKRLLATGAAAGKAAAIEGTVQGATEGLARERAKVIGGAIPEVRKGRVAAVAGISALGAGVPAGALGLLRQTQRARVGRQLAEGEKANAARTEKADALAQQTLGLLKGVASDAPPISAAEKALRKKVYAELKAGSGTLKALDADRVAAGQEVKRKIQLNLLDDATPKKGITFVDDTVDDAAKEFDYSVKVSQLDRVAAATTELVVSSIKSGAIKLSDIKGKRTIDILADQLQLEGKEGSYADILKKYNINMQDVAAMFAAEFSEAGTVLQLAGRSQGVMADFLKSLRNAAGTKLTFRDKEVDKIISQTTIGKRLLAGTKKVAVAAGEEGMAADQARKAFMVSQIPTLIRNTAGATLKLAVSSFESLVQGAQQIAIGTAKGGVKLSGGKIKLEGEAGELIRSGLANVENPAVLLDYLLVNPEAARGVQILYNKNMPESAQRLFRSLADISSGTYDEAVKSGTPILKDVFRGRLGSAALNIARYANAANTLIDNSIKRTVFATQLAEEVGGVVNLNEIIRKGEFNLIPAEAFENATLAALRATYQSGAKPGTVAHKIIGFLSLPGPSFYIPFPRFMASQLEFVYQHTPLLGMIDKGPYKWLYGPSGRPTTEAIAQQVSGLALITGAIQMRVAMGGSDVTYDDVKMGGKKGNAEAFWGPFLPFMILADAIVRTYEVAKTEAEAVGTDWSDPKVFRSALANFANDAPKYYKALIKALLGTGAKSGTNIDVLVRDLKNQIDVGKTKSIATGFANFAGNVVGSSMSNIFVGSYEDYRQTFSGEAYDYKKEINIPPEGVTISPMYEFWKMVTRKMQGPPDLSNPDELAVDPEQTGPTRVRSPNTLAIEGMFMGLNLEPLPEPQMKKALDRLNIQPYQFYTYPNKNAIIKRALNKFYQFVNKDRLIPLVTSDAYKRDAKGNKKIPAQQRKLLTDALNEAKRKGKKNQKPLQYLLDYALLGPKGGETGFTEEERKELIEEVFRYRYNQIPRKIIDNARSVYNRNKEPDRPDFDDLPFKERIFQTNKTKDLID